MYISKVLEFSKDDREADVCVSDGEYDIMCYAYPAESVCLGQEITAVTSYGCKNIAKEDEREFRIKKLPRYYAYSVTAQVLSHKEGVVQIGKIRIQLDAAMPGDISDGDFVSFLVVRFDCFIQCCYEYVNVDSTGITVKKGGTEIKILFDECARNYAQEKALKTSKCVATRDIAKLTFTFFTQPKTVVVFKKHFLTEMIPGKTAESRFIELEKAIVKYGYSSYDLS